MAPTQISNEELERLLADLESDRSERTRSTTDTDKFGAAVCAFANDLANNRQPGYLFINANPDGTAGKAVVNDELLTKLGGLRSDGNILPPPSIRVFKAKLGGGEMAVVEVQPSDMPPVRYNGVVHIRIGPRKGKANDTDERILSERRTSLSRTWDARPCIGTTLEDLALDAFTLGYLPQAVAAEVLQENHRDLVAKLSALRFYDKRTACPTNAALLLFGKDPLDLCQGAYCQYVSYDGLALADTVQQERRIGGTLPEMLLGLRQLADTLARRRPVMNDPASFVERTVYDYPPVALRELLVNAVVHRNYEGSTTPIHLREFRDRIELQSPGGLFGDLMPEAFPDGTAYRNPILAEAAKVLGFANRFGRGIVSVQAALDKNGSPPAEFNIRPNHFEVTIRKRPA